MNSIGLEQNFDYVISYRALCNSKSALTNYIYNTF